MKQELACIPPVFDMQSAGSHIWKTISTRQPVRC